MLIVSQSRLGSCSDRAQLAGRLPDRPEPDSSSISSCCSPPSVPQTSGRVPAIRQAPAQAMVGGASYGATSAKISMYGSTCQGGAVGKPQPLQPWEGPVRPPASWQIADKLSIVQAKKGYVEPGVGPGFWQLTRESAAPAPQARQIRPHILPRCIKASCHVPGFFRDTAQPWETHSQPG